MISEEFYVNELWRERILGVASGDRKARLRRWTVDRKLEALNIAVMVSDGVYESLRKLKRERNKVVHGGGEPSRDVVDPCLKLVYDVVKDRVSKYLAEHMH